MKKLHYLSVFLPLVVLFACKPIETPRGPSLTIVAIGDSITMGIQDAGLYKTFQKNTYPYLISKHMGDQDFFAQPYVSSPGIGVPPYKEPLQLNSNEIIAEEWPEGATAAEIQQYIISHLENVLYPDPYNNPGVNGAKLYDVRHTTTAADSGDNFFFDIVLRNVSYPLVPDFGGKTAVQEAAMLNPDIILLWIGNNDILGTVLEGCGTDGDNFYYTDFTVFSNEYGLLLDELVSITDKIVMANIPAYLPFAYASDEIYQNGNLNLFNPKTFQPIDFDDVSPGGQYLPLMVEETNARYLLLTGAIAYLHLEDIVNGTGLGIPNDLALQVPPYNIGDASERSNILTILQDTYELDPSGLPLPGNFSLTQDEVYDVLFVISEYNSILTNLSNLRSIRLVDIIDSWWRDHDLGPENPAFAGYSGAHPIQNQEETTFSLDGVHPNNLGHALCANAFIEALNDGYNLGITPLDPDQYSGQYTGKAIESSSLKAIRKVPELYAPKSK